jgi:hypothetical protein
LLSLRLLNSLSILYPSFLSSDYDSLEGRVLGSLMSLRPSLLVGDGIFSPCYYVSKTLLAISIGVLLLSSPTDITLIFLLNGPLLE